MNLATNFIETSIAKLRQHGYLVAKQIGPQSKIDDQHLYRAYINSWCIFSPWEEDELIEATIARLLQQGRKNAGE